MFIDVPDCTPREYYHPHVEPAYHGQDKRTNFQSFVTILDLHQQSHNIYDQIADIMKEEDHHTHSHQVAQKWGQNQKGRDEVVKQKLVEFSVAFTLDEDALIDGK